MDITGKVIAVLPEQGGMSAKGTEWKKQEYVIETFDQYPKKICFQIFGADKITQAAIKAGETVKVFFDIDSREYQGRWYTNISAWKVDREQDGGAVSAGVPPGFGIEDDASAPVDSSSVDDLPF